MKNKDVAIHFTKIARDKFQIYNFQTKDNQITNTRDLASYLTNLRGGMALDNNFYSKLISMPNFSTIAITEDALKIKKAAAQGKIEPWKLEKTADGEVFVSAIEEDEEDDTILKKSASCHLKHHYVISIKAKNENQKITTYASLKKSACIPETNIEINPINDYVNFDYYSEKDPYAVIQAIVDLLVATGVAVEPSQVECCHDFCDCGMAQVGPIVPCEEDEYILDCYGEKPIVGQSVDSLQSYASAHNKKHFKIYAFDKVVFDSDAIKRKAADETTQKTKYILAGYTNGKAEFVEKEEYATLDGAKNAFDSFKAKAHKEDEFGNDLIASEFYIYETNDNGTTHDNTWKITSPVDLLLIQKNKKEVSKEDKVPTKLEEHTLPEEPKKEESELEIKEPQPLPTGEKKEEIEEKVETPEGQKLEEKVEETVQPKQASLKISAATREDIITWLEEQIDLHKDITEEELTLNTDFNNKVVVGGPTENILHLEQLVNEKFNTSENTEGEKEKDMHFLVTTEPVEGIEGQTNLTIYINNQGDPTDAINRMSELNADPKVVINKLETGDLLPGTEERKEGIEKLVNDKSKKEVVKDLKEKGHITEEEIKEVKKEDIDKKSKVVKQDGKYQAQSEKGKNFGTYDTKEEAKERVKQMEMFKHMDKKSDASNLIGVTVTYDNGDVITTDVNGNQTDEQIKEYFKVGKEFNLGNGEKDNMAKVVKVDIDRGNIEKEAEKVLIDKNTNQPIKPGDTTEGKELKEVEVEKSEATTTTASNAVYNLFMKSATIEVNRDELSLLTAAYHSPIFKKVAYLGPTAFAFKDQHAIFTVDGNKATCRKEAALTTVEIKKQEQANPGSLDSLSDSQLREYIASLNNKLGVK